MIRGSSTLSDADAAAAAAIDVVDVVERCESEPIGFVAELPCERCDSGGGAGFVIIVDEALVVACGEVVDEDDAPIVDVVALTTLAGGVDEGYELT